MTTEFDRSTDDDGELIVIDGLPEETLVRLATMPTEERPKAEGHPSRR